MSRAAYYKAMLSNKLKDMDVDAEEVNDKNVL
ncbi:MAG: thymidine kinase [Nonlabens sp.]